MADNKPIGRKAEDTASGQRIIITSPPTGIDKVAFLDAVDQKLGSFEGSYQEAVQALNQSGAFTEGMPQAGQMFQQGLAQRQATPEQRWEDYQVASQNIARGEVPTPKQAGETTALGIGGAIAHGFEVPLLNKLVTKTDLYLLQKLNPEEALRIEQGLEMGALSSDEARTLALNAMGIESPDTPTERIVEAGMTGVSQTPMVLGAGNILQAIPGGNLLSKSLRAIGKGVSTGKAGRQALLEGAASSGAQAGAEIAADQGMGPMMTTLMSIGGGMLGDMSMTSMMSLADMANRLMVAKNLDMPEAAQQAIDLFERQGKEAFLSDIPAETFADPSQVAAMNKAQTRRFQRAGGPADLKIGRQRERVMAQDDILEQMGYQRGDFYARDIVDDLIETRSAKLTEQTGLRDEIVDILAPTSDSKEQMAIDALEERLANLQGTGVSTPETNELVTQLRAQIDELLNLPTNNPKVEAPQTRELIQNLRADLLDLDDSSLMPAINKLTEWEAMIENKDFAQILRNKRSIGNWYTSPEVGHLSNNKDVDSAFRQVYNSLNGEIDTFAEKALTDPQYNQWMVSKKTLADMTGELKTDSLREALNKGKYDSDSINGLLKSMNPEKAELLFESLSPTGRNRAKASIIAEVADASRTETGILSPTRFAQELDSRLPQFKEFLDYDDYLTLEGTQRWLERTASDEWAGQIPTGPHVPGESLPGGRYAVARALFSNPALGVPLALGGTFTGSSFAKAMEQGEFRDLLIKLGSLPQSPDAVGLGTAMMRRLNEIARGYAKTTDFTEDVKAQQVEAAAGYGIEQADTSPEAQAAAAAKYGITGGN